VVKEQATFRVRGDPKSLGFQLPGVATKKQVFRLRDVTDLHGPGACGECTELVRSAVRTESEGQDRAYQAREIVREAAATIACIGALPVQSRRERDAATST
jgi:hypothetical protein